MEDEKEGAGKVFEAIRLSSYFLCFKGVAIYLLDHGAAKNLF